MPMRTALERLCPTRGRDVRGVAPYGPGAVSRQTVVGYTAEDARDLSLRTFRPGRWAMGWKGRMERPSLVSYSRRGADATCA